MPAKSIVLAALLFQGANAFSQPSHHDMVPKFMGREVRISEPQREPGGLSHKGPASICVEGPPQRQCYTAPQEFSETPTAAVVHLTKDMPAILFSAASGGGSGWTIHFALLRPGEGTELQDLFRSGVSVSNQSQHTFWSVPGVAGPQIFITADYVWGPDESHYSKHRHIISMYAWKHSSLDNDFHYYLEDQYMTVRKYDLESHADVFAAERQQILARLRRLKTQVGARRRTAN